MLALIAKCGLLLGSPTLYASLVVLGLLTPYKTIFCRALFITAFTMIYNVWLKSIWQIPLPEPLEGWAFPSGHMHCAVVFWGWLAVEIRRVGFSSIIFFILCLVGYGLLYHGYHTPIDIVGSVAFGSLSLMLYWILNKQPYFSEKPYRVGFFLIFISSLIMLIPTYAIKPHMWRAWAILVVLSFSWFGLLNNPIRRKYKNSIG